MTSRTVIGVSADIRLNTEDIAALSDAQARAVFEGIGRLAAATIAQPTPAQALALAAARPARIARSKHKRRR